MKMHIRFPNWNARKNSILCFTVLFWTFTAIIVFRHIDGNTMALGGTDGVQQHYPAMVYIRRYIINLTTNRGGVCPLINYEIGMGDDIITALNYYGFGDPFLVLSIFFPETVMPWFYTMLFYLRVYLGGIAFILFVYELLPEKRWLSYVAGSFLYCFSGFTFEANVHIIFVQAIMYIPLMLYAVERIYKNKKGGRRVLFFSVCGLGCSGFFFTYIGVLATALYALFRAGMIVKKDKISAGVFIIRTGISGALGLGASAIIFVPAVLGYLNSTRSGVSLKVPLFYELDTYKDMFYTFFMGKELYRSVFAFPIVGVIALFLVILTKGYRREKLIVAGCFLGYVIPLFSWIGTGFGAAIYDRWEIVLVIGASVVFVSIWDKVLSLKKRDLFFLLLFYGLVIFLGIVDHMFSDRCYRNTFLAFSGCMIYFVCQVLFPHFLLQTRKELGWFALTVGCIMLSWWSMKVDYPIETVQRDTAFGELVQDDSFYRVENEETFMGVSQINLALTQNYRSTAEYVSIENPVYVETMNNDWRLAMSGGFATSGLDRRTILESLCGVKYMLVMDEHEYLVPYGFAYKNGTVDGKWKLYQNQYVMPLAYTYDKVLDYDIYQGIDALEKQTMMCQAAAIKGYDGSVKVIKETSAPYVVEECYVQSVSETEYASDIYSVREGKVLEVSVPVKANCENYLLVDDKSADGLREIHWNDSSLSPYMNNTAPNFINLGYSDNNSEMTIELMIDAESSLDVRQILVAHIDMENYGEWMEERSNECMQDINISANRVEGSIEIPDNKILCTTIPYLKGWKAFVDGSEVPLYRINSLFMGIEVAKGKHTICFSYCTPGLAVGVLVTLLSTMGGLGWYWSEKKLRKDDKT